MKLKCQLSAVAAAIVFGFVSVSEAEAQTTPEKLWEAPIGQVDPAPAVALDGTIYASAGGPMGTPWKLHAVSSEGEIKWAVDGNFSSAVVGTDGTIFVSGGGLHALNTDGSRKWHFPAAGIHMSPALGADGTIYVAEPSGAGSKLYALDPEGTVKWQITTGAGEAVQGPTVGHDGVIYVGTSFFFGWGEPRLTAVNPDGTVNWSVDGAFSAPAIGEDGTLYVCNSAALQALAPDGSTKWSVAMKAWITPAIGADGTIYVGTQDGLAAVNADGTVKWTFTSDSLVRCTPALDAEGTIYFSSNNKFYVLNPDGTERWSISGGGVSSPAITPQGAVVFGSFNRKLQAYKTAGPLMQSPWPMFAHDPQHSGRAGGTTSLRIAKHPLSQEAGEGSSVTFEVVAESSEPLQYQWRLNRLPIAGATNATYSIRLARPPHAGSYDVIVRNSHASAVSTAAILTIRPSEAFVRRSLPQGFYLGEPFAVVLEATPGSSVLVYAIEDQPPAGWTVGEVSHEGVYDVETGRVKFGPFHDAQPRRMTYELSAPTSGEATVNRFSGIASVEGVPTPVGGDDSINLDAVFHPADVSAADNVMTMDELTAYGFAWRTGEPWPLNPTNIQEAYVTRATVLWRGGERYVYDASQSEELQRWINPEGPLQTPTMEDDGVLSGAQVPATPEDSATTGAARILWELPISGMPGSPAVGPDGTVYVNTVDAFGQSNQLLAFAPDGTPKWNVQGAFSRFAPPSIAPDGTIYTGRGNPTNRFEAYRPDGSKKWSFQIGHFIETIPAIAPDGTVYVSSADSKLYALTPDGTKIWDLALGHMTSPVIGRNGNVYVGTSEMVGADAMVAVGSNGTVSWRQTVDAEGDSVPIVGEGGVIYFLGLADLTALASDGSELWKFKIGDRMAPWGGPAIGTDGTIYFGGSTNKLFAVNPDGTEKWRLTVDSHVSSTPAVAADGSIYFATRARLYGVAPDARMLWSIEAGGWGSSPALTESGTLYFASQIPGKIYAVDVGSGLARSPWPMIGHDPSHTGRAGGSTAFRFTTHPANLSVPAGTTANFSVGVEGDGSFTYQWRRNGTSIPDATNETFTIPMVRTSDASRYDVIVSNDRGSGISAPATLTVEASIPFVERKFPSAFYAGTQFDVVLSAKPPANVEVYAIEEKPPVGWTVGVIGADGVYDAKQKKIKFGPFFDGQARELTYELLPPANGESAQNVFTGAGSANGISSPTLGDSAINIETQLHPADILPADSSITIDEAAAYATAWRKGEQWPIEPKPISIHFVTRSGMLWKRGERYVYDGMQEDPAQRWLSAVSSAAIVPMTKHGTVRMLQTATTGGGATRSISPGEILGAPVRVDIDVSPGLDVAAYAVEDRIPAEWTVAKISHQGVFDLSARMIKWGPFYDGEPRLLSYDISAGGDASGTIRLSGTASFDGRGIEIPGVGEVGHGIRVISADWNSLGQFRIEFDASPFSRCRIEVSDDLKQWTELQTVDNTNGMVSIEDPGAGQFAHRFYRVIGLY